MIACAPGHRFEAMEVVPMADIAGEAYLTRANCEYVGYLDGILQERMIKVQDVYQSEREDWIQSMVLAGMGICFIPEYTPVIPGIVTRPIVEPEVTRTIHIVTVAGRRFDIGAPYGLLFAQLALSLAGRDRDRVLTQLVELLAVRHE